MFSLEVTWKCFLLNKFLMFKLSSKPEPSEAAASWVNPLKQQYWSDSFVSPSVLK